MRTTSDQSPIAVVLIMLATAECGIDIASQPEDQHEPSRASPTREDELETVTYADRFRTPEGGIVTVEGTVRRRASARALSQPIGAGAMTYPDVCSGSGYRCGCRASKPVFDVFAAASWHGWPNGLSGEVAAFAEGDSRGRQFRGLSSATDGDLSVISYGVVSNWVGSSAGSYRSTVWDADGGSGLIYEDCRLSIICEAPHCEPPCRIPCPIIATEARGADHELP